MTETSEKPQKGVRYDDFAQSAESVRRWMYDVGKSFEKFCRLTRTSDGTRFHVYEVRVREKTGYQGGVLLMLKAFGENGAVIAFHSDNSVLQAFISTAERLENGSLMWEVDQYPPKDYEERSLAFTRELSYKVEKSGAPSEG